eukprot:3921657-Amphidinium_carterae.2
MSTKTSASSRVGSLSFFRMYAWYAMSSKSLARSVSTPWKRRPGVHFEVPKPSFALTCACCFGHSASSELAVVDLLDDLHLALQSATYQAKEKCQAAELTGVLHAKIRHN